MPPFSKVEYSAEVTDQMFNKFHFQENWKTDFARPDFFGPRLEAELFKNHIHLTQNVENLKLFLIGMLVNIFASSVPKNNHLRHGFLSVQKSRLVFVVIAEKNQILDSKVTLFQLNQETASFTILKETVIQIYELFNKINSHSLELKKTLEKA